MDSSEDENPMETHCEGNIMIEDDDVTVVSGSKPKETDFIAQEMTEMVLRFEIPYRNGQAADDDFKLHAQLLKIMTSNYDETELRIVDNKNQQVKDFHEEKWHDKPYHNSHFGIHADTSGRKLVVAHRIRSNHTIGTIKSESAIFQFLKKMNTYICAHYWKEDELDIKDIGFLLSYVPTKHSKEYVQNDIFERSELNSAIDWTSAPPFQLIHAQPKIKISGQQRTLRTHAYSVQVKSKDATKMSKFLRSIYDQEPLFMPYSMKKKLPKVVAQAILKQNQLIADLFVVIIIGVSREVMKELKDTLRTDVAGFVGVSDTQHTETTGRWRVLVKAKTFHQTRKFIATNLQAWIDTYPSTLHDMTPKNYPKPQVNQRQGADDDDDSSGHASYMSSCAQSYGSFDDGDATDTAFYDPPARNNHFSYADAARQTQSNNTDSLSGQAIQFQATEKELRSIIANLQKEVQELKGAQTPSTVTADQSTPNSESAQLATRMDNFENNVTNMMNRMSEMLSSKETRQAQSDTLESPPHRSKRADTRHTPERHYGNAATSQAALEPRELWMDNGDGSKSSVGYAAMPGQLGYPRSQLILPGQIPLQGYPYHHPHQHQQELANQALHQSLLRQQRQQRHSENPQQHNNNISGHPIHPSNAPAAVLTSPPRLLAEGALHLDV
jgi:hypothetical protein